ncbi:MAG TPA: efflux RND transporter periplasmic adaptor subunit [Gammaproteobacteria bacterium]
MDRRRRKAVSAALTGTGIAVVIVAAIAGIKALQIAAIGEAFATQVAPPTPVNSVDVERRPWQRQVSSVGSVVAVQGTEVSTEADGVVREILFEPGSEVQAGDALVRLDDEIEQSQLRAAEAAAHLALLTFERAKRLIAENAISRSELESAEAAWKQANAEVDNLRAVIAKKVVRAPFAGKLGIRRVSIGDFLTKGTPVVSLQSLDPVFVEFSVPQRRLGELAAGQRVVATVDAYADERFTGEITAIEPQVDRATRNVRVQATFPNGDRRLRPGMFVSVDVLLERADPVLVIPATAVVHAPHGDSVFVIEPAESAGGDGLVVTERPVQLGARRGDFVVVESGVAEHERIVATGVFKLSAGMPVVVDNGLRPEFALSPSPGNG